MLNSASSINKRKISTPIKKKSNDNSTTNINKISTHLIKIIKKTTERNLFISNNGRHLNCTETQFSSLESRAQLSLSEIIEIGKVVKNSSYATCAINKVISYVSGSGINAILHGDFESIDISDRMKDWVDQELMAFVSEFIRNMMMYGICVVIPTKSNNFPEINIPSVIPISRCELWFGYKKNSKFWHVRKILGLSSLAFKRNESSLKSNLAEVYEMYPPSIDGSLRSPIASIKKEIEYLTCLYRTLVETNESLASPDCVVETPNSEILDGISKKKENYIFNPLADDSDEEDMESPEYLARLDREMTERYARDELNFERYHLSVENSNRKNRTSEIMGRNTYKDYITKIRDSIRKNSQKPLGKSYIHPIVLPHGYSLANTTAPSVVPGVYDLIVTLREIIASGLHLPPGEFDAHRQKFGENGEHERMLLRGAIHDLQQKIGPLISKCVTKSWDVILSTRRVNEFNYYLKCLKNKFGEEAKKKTESYLLSFMELNAIIPIRLRSTVRVDITFERSVMGTLTLITKLYKFRVIDHTQFCNYAMRVSGLPLSSIASEEERGTDIKMFPVEEMLRSIASNKTLKEM